MRTAFIFFIFIGIIFSWGCAKPPPDAFRPIAQGSLLKHQKDLFSWDPSSKTELEERRANQKRFDDYNYEFKNLLKQYADILSVEIFAENIISQLGPDFNKIRNGINQKIVKIDKDNGKIKKEIVALRHSIDKLKDKVELAKKTNEPTIFKNKELFAAVRFFRKKQYWKSIQKYRKILKTHYPVDLEDNILFGLASNYFKLEKYDLAENKLEIIINKFYQQDKWLISHAMLGLIYNIQGKNSKAIYILETALMHNPTPQIKQIIQQLIRIAQNSVSNVSS